MPQLRFLKIEFMDGTTATYSFPGQSANKTVRQVKLESFFKDRQIILHGEGKLTVIPMDNVRCVQLSSDGGDLEGIRLPPHAILDVQRTD